MLRSLLKTPEKAKAGGTGDDDAASEEATTPTTPRSSALAAAAPVPQPPPVAKEASASDSESDGGDVGEHSESDCEFVLFKGDQLRKVVQYRSSVSEYCMRAKDRASATSPTSTSLTRNERSACSSLARTRTRALFVALLCCPGARGVDGLSLS